MGPYFFCEAHGLLYLNRVFQHYSAPGRIDQQPGVDNLCAAKGTAAFESITRNGIHIGMSKYSIA